MKVFYHGDADGECAAAILYNFNRAWVLSKEDFIEMQYEKPVPFEIISKDEDVYIVDFSFNQTDFEKLQTITNNIVWIDHHASCLKYPYTKEFGRSDWCNFHDKGPSGCELTWMFMEYGKFPPSIVEMIGDYDSWRLQIPNSSALHIGLKLYDTHPTSKFWSNIFNGITNLDEIIIKGNACNQYRDAYCKNLIKDFGFKTEILGIKAFACNQYRFGSQGFGDLMNKYQVCIAFIFNGTEYVYSLYSTDPKINCAEICQKFGGGGHKGAAGFHSKELVILRSEES
ncbi:MAG: hypothetical protein M0R80_13170 [Proteobacteria bacterium]|jgi:oligoribonuclease NrnB/cAMP/cGMP phosphodiesterase (DHH superfamily)|nr:hypothetical protein [Pseudomonadota bacterium]